MQGLDPRSHTDLDLSIDPVFRRLHTSYSSLLAVLSGCPLGDDQRHRDIVHEGITPERLRDKCGAFLSAGTCDYELMDSPTVLFESQRFERAEIVRWLKVNGLKSVYAFELAVVTPQQRREYVQSVVDKHHGNKSAAARELKISQPRVAQILNATKKSSVKRSKRVIGSTQTSLDSWLQPNKQG